MDLNPAPISGSRPRFARAERRHPWLGMLLDLYAAIDASVSEAVSNSPRTLACGRGCSHCCNQPIPVTPLELSGLTWFYREELSPSIRKALARKSVDSADCPFLSMGACAVYPLRPVACRRYLVMGQPCAPGETPTESRPDDLLIPSRAAMERAFTMALPFYRSLGQVPEQGESIGGFMARRTVILRDVIPAIVHRGA